jgi:hypothetical protein
MAANSNLLKPKRLGLLLKRDFLIGYRGILITMAASGGFIILVSLLTNLSRYSQFQHIQLFMPLMYIGGFVFTSQAFRELHQGEKSYFYLNLPASPLEKLFSKLLVTSLGYAIGTLAFYSLVALLSEGINRVIFGYGHPLFNPVSRDVLFSVAVYLVVQSIFLLGSIYFRRLAFLKTVVAWNVFAIGTAILIGLTTWLIFRDAYFDQGVLRPEARAAFDALDGAGRIEPFLEETGRGFWLTLKILFWAVLAPVCWIISYFRLKETEV